MQINNPGVLDGSITTAKIADLAVTTAKLALDAVTTDKVANGAVTDLKITGPVSVANGGTGTATPALVAGENIVLSGAFPDQTVGVNATPVFTAQFGEITSNGTDGTDPYASVVFSHSGSVIAELSTDVAGGGSHDFGLYLAAAGGYVLKFDTAGNPTFSKPVPVGSGGTGAASLLAAGVPALIGHKAATGVTADTGDVSIVNAPATGMYRVTLSAWATSLSGSGTFGMSAQSTHGGASADSAANNSPTGTAAAFVWSTSYLVFADSGTAIYGRVNPTGFTSITFDYYMAVEEVA